MIAATGALVSVTMGTTHNVQEAFVAATDQDRFTRQPLDDDDPRR
jgi:hypothetical protein